ncbi:hypothetical protein LIER_18879 [Lithospermum erythrorhizon]|uniref:Uncharacterized protein n=1 Tax=Lithospermum erythrorhizon TaxID=34254 RepID=A0AAV3QGN4_LITER
MGGGVLDEEEDEEEERSSPIKLATSGLATYIMLSVFHQKRQKLNVTVRSPFYIAPEVLSGGYNQAADGVLGSFSTFC